MSVATEPAVEVVAANGAAPARAPAPLLAVLTPETAAELLHLTPEAVRRSAEAGELPGRRVAGEWRFATGAVLGWLARPAESPSERVPDINAWRNWEPPGDLSDEERERQCAESLATLERLRRRDEAEFAAEQAAREAEPAARGAVP